MANPHGTEGRDWTVQQFNASQKHFAKMNRDYALKMQQRKPTKRRVLTEAERKKRLNQHMRRLKVRDGHEVASRDLRRLLEAPCQACGRPDDQTIEHLIPFDRDGRHAIGNLAALCRRCNSSKHNLLWMEWRLSGRPGVPLHLRLQRRAAVAA